MSEVRLIDANDLFKCETCYYMSNGMCQTEWCEVGERYRPDMSKLRVIEIEPVRHGRWEPMNVSGGRDSWRCSECGRRARGKRENLPYCHCGRKMDAEK